MMLKYEKIEMPAAGFDYEGSPLPQLKQLKTVPWQVSVGEDVLPEDKKYINYGCQTPLLPYMMQDRYDRNRKMTAFDVVVLENEYLKATFLPQFGSRLWSLIYKPENRELLYVNPVFQPANFAYRDAWLSGGVEWNMGMPAHNPFTCDKPFAAIVDNDGCPVLRVYEWERIRNAPFQIDFYLPPQSPFLRVRTKLINPYKTEIAGYWFSNIAAPEHSSHRVVVPAKMAYTFDYGEDRFGVKAASVPIYNDTDITYPTNTNKANDFFYRLDDNQWPWITSLDENGCGLIQASTSKLKGRKLFLWGMDTGGRRWQDFLTEPGNPYIELQAGFGRTQVECRPLAPESETEWLEVYGYIKTSPETVHSDNWQAVCQEVETKLKASIKPEDMEKELVDTKEISSKTADEIIQYGSGWAALEIIANKTLNNDIFLPDGIVFPEDSLTDKQQMWLELLNEGCLKRQNPSELICSYQTGKLWKELLNKSIKIGKSHNWTAHFHLGIMNYVDNLKKQAEKSFITSCEIEENHWSYRMLALIAFEENRQQKALDYMEKSWNLSGNIPELAEEYADMLVQAELWDKLEQLLTTIKEQTTSRPRLQVAAAKLAFTKGELEKAEKILTSIELVNIRENETTLSDLWFEIQALKKASQLGLEVNDQIRDEIKQTLNPPANIDFRMN